MYKQFTTAVLLAAIFTASAFASEPMPDRTLGIYNGRWWQSKTDASGMRLGYVIGIGDGLQMADEETQKWYPYYVSYGEMTDAVTRFYDEPLNRRIPVLHALVVVRMKSEGVDAASVEKLTEEFRKLAAAETSSPAKAAPSIQ